MTRLMGRISDRMLSLVAPKLEAQACTRVRMGCCDFCVCHYCCADGSNCACLNCSCQLCG